MKIALTSFYLPSIDKIGVGHQAHAMANQLVRRGHSVTMFSPAPRCDDAIYEHVQVDAGRRLRLHGFAWAMRRVDLSSFDVLHSHGECHWLWRRRVACHVRTLHGSCLMEALHIPGLKDKFRMLCIGGTEILASMVADQTVAVSLNTTKTYPWIKRVIPNGVDLSAFYPGEKEPTPTILFVGTYKNRKRGKWLMEIFEREIRPRVPGVKLWMVCSDAPPQEGVEVLGRLSETELADRYRRAWVFCLPSTYEGFGVPYIEAMAAGTAVVASPNPGSKEVLENGKWGDVANDKDFGNVVVELLTDSVMRAQREHRGLERAQQFSWDRVIERYESLYFETIRPSRTVLPQPRSQS